MIIISSDNQGYSGGTFTAAICKKLKLMNLSISDKHCTILNPNNILLL